MQPLDQIRPEEASQLAMENELLRYEVSHLRSVMAESKEAQARLAKRMRRLKRAGRTPFSPEEVALQKRNQEAYDDLVWLLGRLDASPVGPVLRRIKGYQTLRRRYLDSGEA